ncbi:MAG: histidine ammonia-lyase [Phycisphaeraceae bacterium]|nr:histidine ammonia-lyase [Phycisphaerales bacterium]MCB9842449.1 histidine ammonia-lyase [Phycisphaeraceae bacterium]
MTSSPKQPAHPELSLGSSLPSISEVEHVARRGRRVVLSEAARRLIDESHQRLTKAMAGGAAIYGVNTGFGSLSRKRIADKDLAEVQRNLLRSHAAGVGEPLPDDAVRAMMLLLAASLARGCSGVRPVVVETILALLNAGITPIVPSVGSVGASGDLAPLSHVAIVLMGEGRARYQGETLDGGEALRRAGITPITVGAKEGLALINGTHLMAAQASLALADARRVFDAAMCAAAMSIDANRATDAFLDERVYEARSQPGAKRVAARLRDLLLGSQIITSHETDDPRVQDPYSIRCATYVLGSALDAMDYVRSAIERELGAVTDNPLILAPISPDDPIVVSAGNFHGMPVAIPMDTLAIALSHIAGIAERRVYLLLSAGDPQNPVPAHLSPVPGLHSGLMITQYTAAACCNELVNIANPASVANIPTCAGMEDYNSFGPRACAKARRGVELCAQVVAIELLCAAQAIEHQRPLKSGAGVERAFETIREVVPCLDADRSPSPDIAAIVELILAGRFGF